MKGNSFQIKHKLITTLSFYSSLLFIIEVVFVSEHRTNARIKILIWHMVCEMVKI